MKTIALIFILLLEVIFVYGQSPTFQWAKQLGGIGYDESRSIKTDNQGNVYVAGFFRDSSDFDPGPAVLKLVSAGQNDIFIIKLNSNGNLTWVKRFGSGGQDAATSLTLDHAGNIYVTGLYEGTVDFNPGAAVNNLTIEGTFVLKLDPNGNYTWAKGFTGTNVVGQCIQVDTLGSVFTLCTLGSAADFDPGIGVYTLTTANGQVIASKLDSNGVFMCAKPIGGTSARSFCIDRQGYLCTIGNFSATADFDPGPGISNLTSFGSTDIFISKLDANCNFIWVKQIGGSSVEYSKSIAVDQFGNIYSTGSYASTADFDPGLGSFPLTASGTSWEDIFISKLDSNGNFVWAKSIGSFNRDDGYSICIDTFGNVYTTGYFQGIVDFDPGAGVFTLNSNTIPSGWETFILKLDFNGDFKWAFNFAGPGLDMGSSICTDQTGYVYSTGVFTGPTDFDIDTSVYAFTTMGAIDIFVHKIGQCTSDASVLIDSACSSYVINYQTYTNTGTYVTYFTNTSGCDSIVTMYLTIGSLSTVATMTQSACNSFTLNGQTYSNSGSYTQTLTNSIGCDSLLTLNLTITALNTTIAQSAFSLWSNAAGATYQWIRCENNALIAGATNQGYTTTTGGSYAVIVSNGTCMDTSACYAMNALGMDDNTLPGFIHFAPNPVYDKIIITSDQELQNASLTISNLFGQTILERSHLKGKQFTFDLSNQAKGIYLIELNEDGKMERVKIEVR